MKKLASALFMLPLQAACQYIPATLLGGHQPVCALGMHHYEILYHIGQCFAGNLAILLDPHSVHVQSTITGLQTDHLPMFQRVKEPSKLSTLACLNLPSYHHRQMGNVVACNYTFAV